MTSARLDASLAFVTAAIGLSWPAAATAETPAVVMNQNCFVNPIDHELRYGVDIALTGLPPEVPFVGRLGWTWLSGPRAGTSDSFPPHSLATNAFARFDMTLWQGDAAFYTASDTWAGGVVTETLAATCAPTAPAQCEGRGWVRYAAKSRASCVAAASSRGPRLACRAKRLELGPAAFRAKYGKGRQAVPRCARTISG